MPVRILYVFELILLRSNDRYITSSQIIFIQLIRLLRTLYTERYHTTRQCLAIPGKIYTPHRTIIPYHEHTISHRIVIFLFRIPTKPYHHTIPTYHITYRATPHPMPHRTVPSHVPYHTYSVSTSPEGLIRGHKKSMPFRATEQERARDARWHGLSSLTAEHAGVGAIS